MAALIFRAGSVIDEKSLLKIQLMDYAWKKPCRNLYMYWSIRTLRKAEGNLPDSYESLVFCWLTIYGYFCSLKKKAGPLKTGLAMSVIDVPEGKKADMNCLGFQYRILKM